MALIDKETISNEIERRNLANYCGTAEQYEEELFAILDTLPEQPVTDCHELDNHTIMEEIRKCGCNPNEFDVARHFYELGCTRTAVMYDDVEYERQRAEEAEISKGLEEEVISYFQGLWPGTDTPEECNTHMHFTPPAIMRLARHFAEWGAKHLKNTNN